MAMSSAVPLIAAVVDRAREKSATACLNAQVGAAQGSAR
jgi:hypothetical protein